MTTLTVSLPEALTAYLQEQIASGHYSTADDYIQTLIQQDKERKTQLEPLLLEALASGDPTPMTAADWNTIRATVQQNLTDRPSNGSPDQTPDCHPRLDRPRHLHQPRQS